MEINFFCCDRCGHIIANEKLYTLVAYKNDESDGCFTLCKKCYCYLTSFLNKQCTHSGLPKGQAIMRDFIKEFNSQFDV